MLCCEPRRMRLERILRTCFSTAWPACRPIAGGSEWAGQDSNLRPTDYELLVRRGALVC